MCSQINSLTTDWKGTLEAWQEEFLSTGQCEAMRHFLFHRLTRTSSLREQKYLFAAIAELPDIPLHYRLNAHVGLAWKRIESHDDARIEESLRMTTELLSSSIALHPHTDPRCDRNHVTLSVATVNWHLLLYTERYTRLATQLLWLQDYIETELRAPLSPSFYYTANNMIRGIAVLTGRHFAKGRAGRAALSLRLAMKVLKAGFATATHEGFDHFIEYAESVATVRHLAIGRNDYRDRPDDQSVNRISADIAVRAIRLPGDDRLRQKLRAYYGL